MALVPQYNFSSRAARVLFEALQAYIVKRLGEILKSRVTYTEVVGVMLSALAGICAIGIRTGLATRDDTVAGVASKFIEFLDRDLKSAEHGAGPGGVAG